VKLYTVEGIYFIKLKWLHIFHNKGLASYPVMRKGPYHIPNMTTKLSAVRAISCGYVLDDFQNYMSFVNRRLKISLYKTVGLCDSIHLLKSIKFFAVQFSSATCSFRLLRFSIKITLLRTAIEKIRN
jgi:hypothetical protein